MKSLCSILSFSLFLSAVVTTQAYLVKHDYNFTPDHILRVSVQEISQACYLRETVVVNGTAPGPELRLKPNQTSWVRVYNDMPDRNLTMHWHGLSQSVAPFSDGTPLASQWPIPPLHFFDYELHPLLSESGTYFYHSHVEFQAVSAAGPLIVEDSEETGPPYPYDEERVIFLSEYYNKTDDEIISGLLAQPLVWSGEALAFLFNGQSPVASDQASPPQSTENCGPAMIHVEAGKTYRLRFISGTALSTIAMGIEEHKNFTVIEADGSYTLPASVTYLQLGTAQRYDVIFTAKSEAELSQLNGQKNFWIQLEPRFRPSNLTSYACLSYDGKGCGSNVPSSSVLDLPTDNQYDYLEYQLAPLYPNNFPAPEEVTRRVTIRAAQLLYGIDDQGIHWTLSNHTWSETTRDSPWLVDVYKYGEMVVPSSSQSDDSYNATDSIYSISSNEVIELIWLNEPNGMTAGFDAHPLHAHGGHYYDLGSGRGQYDADTNNARIAAQGHTPVLRDTTMLYKYTPGDALNDEPYTTHGWRAWRVRVQDVGVWMIHCHTLQHMIQGMQSVWVMGNASEITGGQHAKEDLAGYLVYGGSVYGNDSWSPMVNHFYDSV